MVSPWYQTKRIFPLRSLWYLSCLSMPCPKPRPSALICSQETLAWPWATEQWSLGRVITHLEMGSSMGVQLRNSTYEPKITTYWVWSGELKQKSKKCSLNLEVYEFNLLWSCCVENAIPVKMDDDSLECWQPPNYIILNQQGLNTAQLGGKGYILVYLHVSAVFSTLKPMVQKIRFSFKVSNIGSLQRTPFSDNTISEKDRVVLGVDDNPWCLSHGCTFQRLRQSQGVGRCCEMERKT